MHSQYTADTGRQQSAHSTVVCTQHTAQQSAHSTQYSSQSTAHRTAVSTQHGSLHTAHSTAVSPQHTAHSTQYSSQSTAYGRQKSARSRFTLSNTLSKQPYAVSTGDSLQKVFWSGPIFQRTHLGSARVSCTSVSCTSVSCNSPPWSTKQAQPQLNMSTQPQRTLLSRTIPACFFILAGRSHPSHPSSGDRGTKPRNTNTQLRKQRMSQPQLTVRIENALPTQAKRRIHSQD